MTDEQFQDFLRTTLKRDAKPADADAVDRVLARLRGPLPRQKQPLWRLPGVLLNLGFAPARPRMAGLPPCAALRFMFCIAGLDRSFDRLDGSVLTSGPDIGSLVSEPDTLTGERP